MLSSADTAELHAGIYGYGGAGGGTSSGTGGAGGNATATGTLTLTKTGSRIVGTVATAIGGAGQAGKVGGAATAMLSLTASREASAVATATGGGSGGKMGAANAYATAATTASGGSAGANSRATGKSVTSFAQSSASGTGASTAIAEATGTSGNATAQSTTSNGSTRSIVAGAVADVSGSTLAVAQTTYNTTIAPYLPNLNFGTNGQQAFAYANGAPSVAAVDAELAANPNVAAALPGTYTVLGIGAMGANYGATNGSHTYEASTVYNFSATAKTTLKLGLLDITSYDGGFSSLTLTAMKGATVIFSKSFTAIAKAESYFDDHSVGLGTFGVGLQTLTLSYSLTAKNARGADFSYLVTASGTLPSITGSSPTVPVPEPGTGALMLAGLIGIRGLAGRRKAPGGPL